MRSSRLTEVKVDLPISNREYRDLLIHDWVLPQWVIEDHLEVHMVKQIKTEDLLRIIKDGDICVGRDFYSVVWLNSPNRLSEEGRAVLSFRYCKHMLVGYCLIKSFKDARFKKEPKPLDLSTVRFWL